MQNNHPPRVRAMLDRLRLIKTDLSRVTMAVSLEGAIRDLPETVEILASVDQEDKQRWLTAVHEAFGKRDLTKVSALFSYIALFPEADRREMKSETMQDFQLFLRGHANEDELNGIFLHPGFSQLIKELNAKELTDLQFRLFARYHLENKTNMGRRIAGVQKNLPLDEVQMQEVIRYLDEIKAEKAREAAAENKATNKGYIWLGISIVLIIIRIILKMSR